MVAIARLVVVALLAVIVTACSGPVGTPTSGSPTAPGPTTPWIRVDSFWPGPGATMRHSNTVEGTGEISTVHLSGGLGDARCDGPVSKRAALTDRPGEFIWDTVDATGVDNTRPLHLFLRNSPRNLNIRHTPIIVAWLVCGQVDFRPPLGGDAPAIYKAEADFKDFILARVQVEVNWNWVPPVQ